MQLAAESAGMPYIGWQAEGAEEVSHLPTPVEAEGISGVEARNLATEGHDLPRSG
jgi:hypothetical protein